MELVHATGMQAGYTYALDKEGRQHFIVCLKGTFLIPEDGKQSWPSLAPEQLPLVEADSYTGEPGLSGLVYESDYVLFKPYCDVLLQGFAYAPDGGAAEKVRVGLSVGDMSKSFLVLGDRYWQERLFTARPTEPEPFVKMPVTYERAFGGLEVDEEGMMLTYPENPIGRGFNKGFKATVYGTPLPNTQELKRPITKPGGNYTPMAFGPVGRTYPPRLVHAGTYDDDWLDNVFPFLPVDFDPLYFQSAPPDQQIPHPKGGEPVVLTNLTPRGETVFALPQLSFYTWFLFKNDDEAQVPMLLDTLYIEPELERFSCVWRSSIPLKKDVFEITHAVIGQNLEEKDELIGLDDITFPLLPEIEDEEFEGDEDFEDDEAFEAEETDEENEGEASDIHTAEPSTEAATDERASSHAQSEGKK
jgi:hypothetical protein